MSLASQLSFLQSSTSTLDQINSNFVFAINSAERFRITQTGGIAFGGSTNYGTSGQLLQSNGNAAPTWVNASGLTAATATTATNIAGGTAGQLHYQSAPGITTFAGPGTAGQILLSAGTSAPVYTNTASVYVGAASSSVNLFGGTAGQFAYQTAAGATAFISTGSMYVNRATIADSATSVSGAVTTATNVAGGTAGQLHYQSAVGVTAFAGPGTAGQLLVSAGTAAPVYTNTASIYVGAASSSVNLFGGTAGQFAYQTAAGATAFISTGSMYVNRATIADSASGSSAQINTIQQTSTATYYPVFVDSNNVSSTAETVYTTSSFVISPGRGNVGFGVIPSNWGGIASNVLEFKGGGHLFGVAADNYLSVGSNAYYDGTDWRYKVSAKNATMYHQDQGRHEFFSAPAGTADAVISGFVNRFQILDTGGIAFGSSGNGTTGQLLSSNGINAPSWVNASGLAVATATNLAGGTAGQFAYQTGAGATAFISTGSMYVNRATVADSVSGGSSQVNTVAQPANASYFPTFVDANNAASTSELIYTTSSFVINPSTGNVGIGTSSPGVKLEVVGTQANWRKFGNDTAPFYQATIKSRGTLGAQTTVLLGDNIASTQYYAYNGTSEQPAAAIIGSVDVSGTVSATSLPGALSLQTTPNGSIAPVERMRIDSSGNVGIGTTSSPLWKLHVQTTATGTDGIYVSSSVGGGNAFFRPNISTGANNAIVTQGDAGIIYSSSAGIGTGGFVIAPWNNTIGGIRLDSIGNLGIGTSTPTNAGTGYKFITAFGSTSSVYQAYGAASTDARFFAENGYGGTGMFSNHPYLFYTNSSERMRIDINGNVGIGTNNPSYKLDVNGGSLGSTAGNQVITQRLAVTSANVDLLEISNLRTSAGSDWTTAGWRLQQKIDATWMGYIQFNGVGNNGGIAFGTGNTTTSANSITERVRITPNGGVAFGGGGNYGTAGQVLQSNGDAAPTWVNLSSGLFTRITTNTTVIAGSKIIADTAGGAFTLTLPALPATGAAVEIADGANWATNNLTVGRNGQTIEGSAADLVLNTGGGKVELVYDGTTWEVYSNSSSGGGATIVNTTTNASTFYISMADATSGAMTTSYVSNTKLYFVPLTGTLNATIFNTLSDYYAKDNIVSITNAVEIVNNLKGVEFTWKDNGQKSAGVIAQQLETILPHLVDTDSKGTKSVNYQGIIGYLIESIKELETRLVAVESKLK